MKKIFAVAVTLLIVSSAAFGQEGGEFIPNLVAGSKAVLFSFDNFDIGTFERSSGIGAKYYVLDNLAARARLSFVRAGAAFPANPPSGQTGKDGEASAIFFGASTAVEWHLGAERVSPYLGGRIDFSSTATLSKSAVIGSIPQTTILNNSKCENIRGGTYCGGIGFNVSALAGVEFFLLEDVSLGTEYRFGFTNVFGADEEVRVENATTTTTKQGSSNFLGFSTGAGLTLAIYF